MKKLLSTVVATLIAATSVQADVGISIKALTAAALRSETGMAKAPITDRPAEMLRLATQSNAQTLGEVKVLERYTDDCGKIRLSLIQPNALKRDGSRDTFQINNVLNVCANGQPYEVRRK